MLFALKAKPTDDEKNFVSVSQNTTTCTQNEQYLVHKHLKLTKQ